MEDKFIKEFDNLYDDQPLKEYGKKFELKLLMGEKIFQKEMMIFL